MGGRAILELLGDFLDDEDIGLRKRKVSLDTLKEKVSLGPRWDMPVCNNQDAR